MKSTLNKPKLLVIIADLDKTLTPALYKDWDEEMLLTKHIEQFMGWTVKVVLNSGRPAGYMQAQLRNRDDNYKEIGKKTVDYAIAEQGAYIHGLMSTEQYILLPTENGAQYVRRNFADPSLAQRIQYAESFGLSVAKIIGENYDPGLVDVELKNCSQSIHCFEKDPAKRHQILQEVQKTLETPLKELFPHFHVKYPLAHDCMEAVPSYVSKAHGAKWVLDKYEEEYEIIGCIAGGDNQNDLELMNYVAGITKFPTFLFCPANSHEDVKKLPNIYIASKSFSKGVIESIEHFVQIIRDLEREKELQLSINIPSCCC